jgi:thimet oligopeptidase
MIPRSLCLVSLVALATACGGEPSSGQTAPKTPQNAQIVPPPTSTSKPLPPPVLAPFDVDPVFVGLGRKTAGPGTPAEVALARKGVEQLCDESLARARATIDEIRRLDTASDDALTWDATVGKLDRVKLALGNAGQFPALMAVAHPDDGVRERAKLCEPRIDKLDTELWLDAKIANVTKRYAAKKETLTPVRARLLAHTLRDFRRSGLDLDAKGRKRITEINAELTKLGLDFDTNLAESHLVVFATPAQLEGLPKEWVTSHPPNKDGKIEITTDYPDYYPVLQYAKDRKLALDLYKQFENRAADKNLAVIDRMLALRSEKAKLLGYPTWADYVLEPRMAKDAKTVSGFLDSLRKHLAKKGDAEVTDFKAAHVKLGGKATDPMLPSDRLYLEDQVRKAKYGLDSKEVSKYFEVRRVKEGLLAITSKLFDIRFRPAADAPTWHPDVEAMEVTDAAGKVIGRFYFDLFPRDNKYKHAAVFSIRDTTKMPDGSRLMPIAAIECNFPKPGGAAPALMSHADAVTFFHEFGHVIHHLLSESELSSFAGTNVARDFVEAPSQMLEEWAWQKETLDTFARHHDTNAPLPAPLHGAMLRSRGFGRALATQRQLYLAALDQAYHTRPLPFDTTKVLAEINDAYTPFKYIVGTHFQASFGHLIGYDAVYYGYQWALSIAQDMFTRFKKQGLMNTKTAADYRAMVLAPGDSDDANRLVEKFLGHAPSDAAYKTFLLE